MMKITKNIIILVVVVVVILILLAIAGILIWYFLTRESDKPTDEPTDEPPSSGGPFFKQAVATDTLQCSKIGNDTLSANGSAVDAAIAAMFCLGVINMHSSGIGGGGVMLVYNRSLNETKVFDFRETAPATATPHMFPPNKTGENKSKFGGLSIAVPGEIHGQYQAWKQYGQLPWEQLVQPAIDLARNGFEISTAVDDALTDIMVEAIKKDSGLSELLLDKNKEPYKKGDKITNKPYARTLEKIQKEPEAFYNGSLARQIYLDIRRAKGEVSEDDLRMYKTVERKPLESELSGMKMYLTPPPTSGAVLALILNILKGYNMTSSSRDGVNSSVLAYHRIIEAFKFGYAWRSQLGDPDSVNNSQAQINKTAQEMTQQQLGDWLRQKILDNKTHENVSYYAESFSDADYGTTHVAVLAPNGDAVSVTTTINFRFGSRYRSNITGIIYNNQMADFDIPGYNIVDGISPSPFNFPEPRKRPFSSMSPAILTDDDGNVELIIGASGGKRITTAVSQVLMNKMWFGQNLTDAVDEPRVHTQLVPDQNVHIEKKEKYRLDSKIVEGLKAIGHNVTVDSDAGFAVVQAVYRDPKEGIYVKSDPRKFGSPAGQ